LLFFDRSIAPISLLAGPRFVVFSGYELPSNQLKYKELCRKTAPSFGGANAIFVVFGVVNVKRAPEGALL
jgi:hypothetical protein